MPSGAKKRKASKKKKESQVKGASQRLYSTAHDTDGEEDLKQNDDRDSEGGEISSPVYHDNRHRFMEGEEEEVDKRDEGSNDFSFVEEQKSNGMKSKDEQMENVMVEEGSILQVERVLKVEDELQTKNMDVEYIEPPMEPQEGGLLSSLGGITSSNSEDESNAANKNRLMADDDSIVDSVKEADSLSADNVTDGTPSSDVGTACIVDLDKVPMLGEAVQVTKSTSTDNNMTSYAVESGLIENGEAKLSAVYESFTVSEDVMDLGLGKEDNQAIQTSHDNAIEVSDAKCSVTQENGYKLTVSCGAPRVDADMGSDPFQDSVAPECSDIQPHIGSSLRPVQTTSWKSCCGLFELFTGSGSR